MNNELVQPSQFDVTQLAEVFSAHRDRLLRMVRFRLDPSLRGRVDPEDILQEAYIKIAGRLQDYLDAPNVSFYVWARQITWQIVIDIHRAQMGLKRNPNREVRGGRDCGNATASSIAHSLMGSLTSPSVAAMRQEQVDGLHEALDSMDEIDREVLALRHFEELENNEVAEVLGLSRTAASNRYVRALARLKKLLISVPEFGDAL